jgi:MoaA/NifB/PqqE/SkfB family radical SAM enzyme
MSIDKFLKDRLYDNLVINTNYPVNSKAWIDIGNICNARCPFCYQKCFDDYISIDDIEKQIKFAKLLRIEKIEFSGGEFTIHPDLEEILNISNKYYKKDNISILTNGFKLYDLEFCKFLDTKISEMKISVHSIDKSSKIYGRNGFVEKVLQGVDNIIKHTNIKLSINITINDENIQIIEEYIDYINKLPINYLHILPENNWGLKDKKLYSNRNRNITILNKYLDYIDKNFRLRYVPYCLIDKKHWNKIYNLLQHIFDLTDWNILFNYLRDYDFQNIDYYISVDKIQIIREMYKIILGHRFEFFEYREKCFKCDFMFICDGFEKGSYNVEYTPITIFNKKIKDPTKVFEL